LQNHQQHIQFKSNYQHSISDGDKMVLNITSCKLGEIPQAVYKILRSQKHTRGWSDRLMDNSKI